MRKQSIRDVFMNMSSGQLRGTNEYYSSKIELVSYQIDNAHNCMKKYCMETPNVEEFKTAKSIYDKLLDRRIKYKTELKILRSVAKRRRIEL